MSHHGRTRNRAKVLDRIGRLCPVGTTVSCASVVAEEGLDPLGTEIGDAILSGPRDNDRIGEDHFGLVDASLKVAKHVVAARDMVAKVAQGLHDLGPLDPSVVPSRVAVELLVVGDERLDQRVLSSPATEGGVLKPPHGRDIDLDGFGHDAELVEAVDKFQCLVDSLDVKPEEIVGKDCARLEPLGDAGLTTAWALGVRALGNPAKSTGGEGVGEGRVRKGCLIRLVVTSTVEGRGFGAIKVVAMNAACASRVAVALGPLVICI